MSPANAGQGLRPWLRSQTHGGKRVAAIQEEILNEFFRRLGKSDGFEEERAKALHALFSAGGKLKADDLVAAYVAAKKEGTV